MHVISAAIFALLTSLAYATPLNLKKRQSVPPPPASGGVSFLPLSSGENIT
jgi:hypothetical protein